MIFRYKTVVILIFLLLNSIGSSTSQRILRSDFIKDSSKRLEPIHPSLTANTRESCPVVYPTIMDAGTHFSLIDSSANGYGMASSVTRPIDVNDEGWRVLSYRRFYQVGETHGQIASAVSSNGHDWIIQKNINYAIPPFEFNLNGNGRFPSSAATKDTPYVFWNETENGLPPIGGPYYSFDEFGYQGQSWLFPYIIDSSYNEEKSLWEGSTSHGYNSINSSTYIISVFDDWYRSGNFLYKSKIGVNGFLQYEPELLIINPIYISTDGGSSATISMNDNGEGIVGLIGYFQGAQMEIGCISPAAEITCKKVPIFKFTEDWGVSWQEDPQALGYYYVQEEIFDNIMSNWPSVSIDACTGEESEIIDFWSGNHYDFRVDSDGNPHIVMSMIPASDMYFHFMDGVTGFYHLTIDRDYLDDPGAVNTPTGWNWSFIPLPANDSFQWLRPDGYSYLYSTLAQISLVKENSNMVYVVANVANEGVFDPPECDTTPDCNDDCLSADDPSWYYPNWSEDIWMAVSDDNGSTWDSVYNVTQTPRNGHEDDCSPEEQYVHTAHWSTVEEVYIMYQQPDWKFNEIGDPLGIDHKNRIFAGYASVYGEQDDCSMYFSGDVNLDGNTNVLDIVKIVSHILDSDHLEGCGLVLADTNDDGEINILDIMHIIFISLP